MYYAFTVSGNPICVHCSKVTVEVEVDSGEVSVTSMQDNWVWNRVEDIQVIEHPQDCLAWMGLCVDTCGNPPSSFFTKGEPE